MSKKILVLLTMLALVIFGTSAFAQSEGTAAIRFVHVLDGAPAVDVYTDGNLSFAGLDFGDATPYITVTPGSRTVTVTVSGDSSTLLWTQAIDIAAAQALVAVVSSNNPLEFALFQDDLNPLPAGRSRLTAIHAIPDAPAVDIMLADGRPVIPNLQYNQPYGTLDIPSQSYELVIAPTGGSVESALVDAQPYSLTTGTSYIALAYGTAEQPNVLVLSAPTLPNDANSGYVRIVHAADGGGAVDVRANGALIAPGLNFGQATQYVSLTAGDYSVSLTPAGSDASGELVSSNVTIEAGTRSTVVASANGGSVILSVFSADGDAISASEAQFTLSNVGEEAASASFTTGEAIVASVDAEDFVSTALQPGTADIAVAAGQETTEFGSSGTYGGILYDAVVYPSDGGSGILTLPLVSLPLTADPVGLAVAALQPTATQAVIVAAQPTTVTPDQQVQEPAAQTAQTTGPTARVVLNEGANLHLRLYPSAEAFSMGLAPNGTVFRLLGREGAPVDPDFFTPTPTPEGAATPTPFIDPVSLLGEDEDLDPRQTWVFIEYDTPDGGVITAWVNSLYLDIRDERGRTLQLRELPTIPRNRAGELGGQAAGVAPTANPFRNVNVATVQGLAAGANLHLRRNPNAQSESLALIPSGTTMIISGRTVAGDWLEVEYQGQIGWVSAPFVTVSYNDRPVDILTIEILATATPTSTATPG